MKRTFLICFVFSVVTASLGSNDCSLGELKDYEGTDIFQDIDKIIHEFNGLKNIKDGDIQVYDMNDKEMKYAEVKLEDNKLILISKEMSDFEDITPSSKNVPDFPLKMKSSICNPKFNKDFNFYVNDTNNHYPYFVNENLKNTTEFIYEIPMPFPAGLSLELIGKKLWARDIDISNVNVTFNIEPKEDFGIDFKETVSGHLNKVHAASLTSKQTINFDDREYIITVTDGGTPSKSSTSKLVVRRMPGGTVPEFEKAVYEGKYNETSKLVEIEDQIKLKKEKNVILTVEVENTDYDGYFSADIDEDGIVKINVNKPIDSVPHDFIVLKLNAKDKDYTAAKTVIVLKINKIPKTKFTQTSYEGQVDLQTGTIQLLSDIQIENPPEDVSVRIAAIEDYEDNFKVTYDPNTRIVDLTANLPLKYTEENYVSFKIEAVHQTQAITDVKIILTLINRPMIHFEETTYKGNFDLSTNNLEGLAIKMLNYENKVVTPSIIPNDGYENNFDTKIEDEKFIINVNPNDPVKYKGEEFISFEIQAKVNDKELHRAVVVLKLINIPLIRFEEPLYTGSIDFDFNNFDYPTIHLENYKEAAEIKLQLSGFEDIFVADLRDGIVNIEVQGKNDFIEETSISLNIMALVNNEIVSNTVLALKVHGDPSTTTTEFEKAVYEGEYKETSKLVEIKDQIKLKKEKNVVLTVEVENTDYDGYFSADIDEDGIVKINVNKPIDSVPHEFIVLKLNAKDKDYTAAKTVIVLKINKIPKTKFTQTSYEGQVDLQTGTIQLLSDIQIENPPEDVSLRIAAIEDYEDNFKVTYDPNTRIVNLTANLPLKYNEENYVSFKIEAVHQNQVITDVKIILTLINRPMIHFEETTYKGNFDLSTNNLEGLAIKMLNYENKVVTPSIIPNDGYENNFDTKIEDEKFIINVNPNDPVKYKGEEFISFEIQAKVNDKELHRAVVVLKLINIPLIRFEEPLYTGSIDFDFNNFDYPTIHLENYKEASEINLQLSDFGDIFVADLRDGIVNIEVQGKNDFIDDTFISLNIMAVVNNDIVSNTALVLKVHGDPSTTTTESTTTTDSNTTTTDSGSETTPTDTESTSTESDTSPSVSDTTPTDSGTTPTDSGTTSTSSDTTPTDSDTTETDSETSTSDSGTTSTSSDTTPTDSDTTETDPETSTSDSGTSSTSSDTTPTGSGTTATDSEPTSTGSETTPTDSGCSSTTTDSGSTQTDAETTSTDTGTTSSSSDTSSTDSGTTSTGSETISTDSGTTTTSGSTTSESESTPTDSETTPTDPGTKTTESGSISTGSVTTITEFETTPTSSDPTTVYFVDPETQIIIEPTTTGEIGRFLAKSTNPVDVIAYSLKGDVPENLNINKISGTLVVDDVLPSKYYRLNVLAEGSSSKVISKQEFWLNVESEIVCDDKTPRVPNSYQIIKVLEGLVESEVLSAYENKVGEGDFEYCIARQDPDPETEEKLFFVDNGVVKSRNLDREASYLIDMVKPQFLLTLKLAKKGSSNCGEITRKKRESSLIGDVFLYEKIDNSPIKTTLTVIVGDIHDNSPKFGDNEITVCYPNKDLLEIVRPMYITKVYASHLDSIESKFGIVKYSTEDSEIFVDPSAGYVFPTDKFYSSTKRAFTIVATDGGNKIDELTLKVKIIDENKISILKLANVEFDNLENKLKELSLEANINLTLLSAASIPANEKKKLKDLTLSNEEFSLEVFVYGLDAVKEPVDSKEMEKSLEDTSSVEVSKFDRDSCDPFIEEDDVTGMIAAIAVLGVLLILCIVGFLALWYFKFRNRNNVQLELEEVSPETYIDTLDTYEKKFESHLISNDNYEIVETKPMPRRQTGFVFDPPPVDDDSSAKENDEDTDSDSSVKQNSIQKDNESDSDTEAADRRKSVSFNNTIERFQINKTADDDDDDNSDKSESDNDEKEDKEKK